MYQASEGRKNMRRCIITSQNSAYYRILEKDKEVEIIVIFDTRQNSNNLDEFLR